MSARDFNELPPLEVLTDAAQVIQQARQAAVATSASTGSAAELNDTATTLQAIAAYEQINLLPTQDSANLRGGLPWWSPIACAAVVAALALGSSLPLGSSVAARQAQVLGLEAQLQQKTSQLAALAKAAPGGTVAEQSLAMQAAVTQQERLLGALGGALGGTLGGALGGTVMVAAAQAPGAGALIDPAAVRALAQDFSKLLEALSRTRVEGLWLTQVRIDKRNQELKIEGQARDAQMVSGYIDELSRNPQLKGLVVSAVEVTRPAAATAITSDAVAAAEPARFKLALASKAAPVLTTAAATATAAATPKTTP